MVTPLLCVMMTQLFQGIVTQFPHVLVVDFLHVVLPLCHALVSLSRTTVTLLHGKESRGFPAMVEGCPLDSVQERRQLPACCAIAHRLNALVHLPRSSCLYVSSRELRRKRRQPSLSNECRAPLASEATVGGRRCRRHRYHSPPPLCGGSDGELPGLASPKQAQARRHRRRCLYVRVFGCDTFQNRARLPKIAFESSCCA